MIVNKLLSVKKDNNIILYIISFDDEKLHKFLEQLNSKYSRKENDVIETTFSGILPLSYGKYDKMKDICNIKELGIVENKKEIDSEEYFKSLGGTSKEWSFLSNTEKLLFMPITGTRKGKLKLEVEYPSILCKLLEETFFTSYDNCILDGTQLTKLTNHVLNLPNNFKYDKTIDLNPSKEKWNDETRAFLNESDYNNYLSKASDDINKDDIKITAKEENAIYHDLGDILYSLFEIVRAEQIGMFPMNIELTEELEILKRFGIRNEHFEWLDRSCKFAQIDYDGGAILNELRNKICNNYDLDGKRKEEKILSKIEKAKPFLEKFYNNGKETDEVVIIKDTLEHQKIKAA